VDTLQLTQQLQSLPPGSRHTIANTTITAHVTNGLFVPVRVPSNVSVTFEGVTFGHGVYFSKNGPERLTFKDCTFGGVFGFQSCIRGDSWFSGSIVFGSLLELRTCEDFAIQFGDDANITVNQAVGVPGKKNFDVLNISVEGSDNIFIKLGGVYNGHLNVGGSRSSFSFIDLSCNQLTLRLWNSAVESLNLKWNQLEKLELSKTKVDTAEFNATALLSIGKFNNPPWGATVRQETIEELARARRRLGYERDFLKLMVFAVKSRVGLNLANNMEKLKNKNLPSTKKAAAILSILSQLVQFNIFVRPFGRFYRWEGVIALQLMQVAFYAAVYSWVNTFKDISAIDCKGALYFSAMTTLTISYGDFVPLDGLKMVAMTQGFVGVSLNLILAFTLSRRYGS
jgi:hypothetical protein